MYRICKQFEFQAAHVLSKHRGKCRYPHGHSYRVEITLIADELDENDMVCDFHAISAIVKEYIDTLDHCIMLNGDDSDNCIANKENPRCVIFEGKDPTSEVLAKTIFEHIDRKLSNQTVRMINGIEYRMNASVKIEKVRVWETSSAWAEYSRF